MYSQLPTCAYEFVELWNSSLYSLIFWFICRNSLNWNAVPTLVDVPNPPQKLASKRPAPTCRTPVCKQPRLQTTQEETIDELGNTIIVILYFIIT